MKAIIALSLLLAGATTVSGFSLSMSSALIVQNKGGGHGGAYRSSLRCIFEQTVYHQSSIRLVLVFVAPP
eukprot:scaffold783_cov197-Alexandrium_tamarense.AAC.18